VSEPHQWFEHAFEPRYRFVRELGRGGMGIVRLYEDAVLERRVAIKFLPQELATAVACERFLREARTLAKLDHPNVVHVHDAGERDGCLYFVMDFIDAPTLKQRLEGGERLAPSEARSIGIQMLGALARMHAIGILHRDIKPANIFVLEGHAWLSDFGIASQPGQDGDSLTRTGQLLGTREYMAPEQLDGRSVDGRSDLYSLALVLAEALTGRRPTTLDTQVLKRMPRALASVLQRALSVSPADRWARCRRIRDRPGGQRIQSQEGSPTAARVRSADRTGRRCVVTGAAADAAAITVAGRSCRASAGVRRPGLDRLAAHPPRRQHARAVPAPTRGASHRDARMASQAIGHAVAHDVSGGRCGDATGRLSSCIHRDPGPQRPPCRGTLDERRHGRPRPACLWPRRFAGRILASSDLQAFRNIRYRPASVQATRDYFDGEDAFQRSDWSEAERAFERALERDPQFVQAQWSLMIARRFQRKPFGDVQVALVQAMDGLPPFYRGLLQAQLEPDVLERLGQQEALVRASPGSGEARLHYTNELFHRGALVGRPLAATLDTMSRWAGEFRDLHHASTYDLTIWGNIRLGREEEAWRQFHRRAALVPPDDEYGLFHRYALWSRFSPWKAGLMRMTRFLRPTPRTLAELARLHRLGLTMDVPQAQVDIGRLLDRSDAEPWVREAGIIGQALGVTALGRPSEGLGLLDRLAGASDGDEIRLQRLEWPVVLAALGLPVDSELVARARQALGKNSYHAAAAARASFALGLDAFAHGDSAGGHRYIDVLASGTDPVAGRLAILLGARLDAARGAHAVALERSRIVHVLDSASYRAGPFARAATYLARGESQRALGDWVAADREWDGMRTPT
jgi:hypothetical protein